MPDADWSNTDGPKPAPCKPRHGNGLWSLAKHGKRIEAELLFHGEYGVEIQFLHEGVMAYGRRWTLRTQAIDEGRARRRELEQLRWAAG